MSAPAPNLPTSEVHKRHDGSSPGSRRPRPVTILALLAVVTFLVAYAVLASTINWPQSLDLPAAEALRLVVAERQSLLTGYALYLAYSLALVPLAVLLPRSLGFAPGRLLTLGVAVGAISATFRALGIVRWLTAMPPLADVYVAGAPGSATREAATVAYTVLNDYAGGIGELLGVALTGAAWVVLVAAGLRRSGGPNWLVVLSGVTAIVVLSAIVVDGAIAAGTIMFLIWLGSVGVVAGRRERSSVSAAPTPVGSSAAPTIDGNLT